MKEANYIVKNPTGLHARPAAVIVSTAVKFRSKISASKSSKEVNLKSLLSLLSLGVCVDEAITLRAEGSDENAAIEAILQALDTLKD